ncbi:glycosyltransferase [Minwuia sp.]|uniref:glycosyltransferase n=1 Tax=Minwuia sp. TaxID=2493630 RepID=UPI003A8DA67D
MFAFGENHGDEAGRGEDPLLIMRHIRDDAVDELVIVMDGSYQRADWLLEEIRRAPGDACAWFSENRCTEGILTARYFDHLSELIRKPHLLDLHAAAGDGGHDRSIFPFNQPDVLPPLLPAQVRQRTALFLHNSYYHFNHLSDGLKQRGWETLTVSVESPQSASQQFYHGEDMNLFDPDPAVMDQKLSAFFQTVPERFGAMHFYGSGNASFNPRSFERSARPTQLPWDFLELRRHRTVIGYMPSGCMDGGLQSSVRDLTGGLCSKCVWEKRPDVCSDALNGAWNRKLLHICDWIGLEADLATTERVTPKTVYGPVATAIDAARWSPGIDVSADMRIDRAPDEILIYHAVGNYQARRHGGRDIKGTGAVFAAIERLKQEGLPVRLIFAHDIPSSHVRFLQVQADIVVDQLNYGRYGANAREAMMLGRPTICRLDANQAAPQSPLRAIADAPLIDADEDSLHERLRELVLHRELRDMFGARARKYAVAWFSSDACAARYERVIERIREGLPPEAEELYPHDWAD